ncbi:hypothetical protein C8R44DRAFT_830586 [Mycena epipterygia]|nr:hypothetical protein C8R44DRAFT_830586 [Mycena epipterygia]
MIGEISTHCQRPNRTTAIGDLIDSYLRSQSELDDRAIHLFFSANRSSTIEQLLAEGTTAVCDRYAFSGVAFSAAKGLSFDCYRSPDARERGGYGEERYEKEEMQRKSSMMRLIDAGREREDVAADIWKKYVHPLATSALASPLQRLLSVHRAISGIELR